MLAFDFLRDPSKPGVKPVYAVVGDDPYLRHEALTAITRVALSGEADELAVARFAGESASLADVLDEVRTLPFLAKARVAIVENADPFVTAHRKELEAYAEHPSTTGVLALAVKTWPGNTKLAKLVEKVGLAIDCKTPAERELPTWLVGLARSRYDLRLAEDAARLLVELVGPEVGLLSSELEKLSVYVGDRKTIQRDDVTTMVGAGRVEVIWEVLRAATTGRAPQALADLDRLLGAGEHPVGLLAAMTASLRKVYHAGHLRLNRVEIREACREAGIPTFPAAIDSVQNQHKHLGPGRVARLPATLLQADLDLKGSSQLPPAPSSNASSSPSPCPAATDQPRHFRNLSGKGDNPPAKFGRQRRLFATASNPDRLSRQRTRKNAKHVTLFLGLLPWRPGAFARDPASRIQRRVPTPNELHNGQFCFGRPRCCNNLRLTTWPGKARPPTVSVPSRHRRPARRPGVPAHPSPQVDSTTSRRKDPARTSARPPSRTNFKMENLPSPIPWKPRT